VDDGSQRRVVLGIRVCAGAAFVALFVQQSAAKGLPFDRERLLLWILGGLSVTCFGRPWRRSAQLVTDWLPFVAVLFAYDYSRGLAQEVGMPLQVTPQLHLEKLLFFGRVPSVWLQQHLYHVGEIRWWDVVVSVTYTTHFVLPFVVAGVLWAYDRGRWRRFVNRFVVVSFAGVATFALLPSAAPWMASDMGLLPHLERNVGYGWSRIDLPVATQLIDKGRLVANPVAAVPSLHAAWALLIGLFFWSSVRRRWLRPLLLVQPLLMAFTVVYGAEHYAVDVLAGWAYVAATFVVCGAVERWWARRRGPAIDPPPVPAFVPVAPLVPSVTGAHADAPLDADEVVVLV